MVEIWKPIIGFEGLYEISNMGMVKSLERTANVLLMHGVRERVVKERILKTYINKGGYHCTKLNKNNKYQHFTIHRLIAIHFIPNEFNKPCINHKDGNKLNNELKNLEWCTISENKRHAHNLGLIDSKASGLKIRKAIIQYDLHGNFIAEYCSYSEAVEKTGCNNITKVCKGIYPQDKGFIFKYKNQ